MNDDIRQQAIALYDRFTHEGTDRRLFMSRMVALAGSLAAAEALIGAISASPAAAAIIPESDARIRTSTQNLLGMTKFPRHTAYVAEPARGSRGAPTLLVIHENRGLNAHIKDVARRLAVAGFYAVAPDFLSPSGGTPANEDEARDAIGELDLAAASAAAVAGSPGRREGTGGTRRATSACSITRCSSSWARSGARPAHSRSRRISRAWAKYRMERIARPKNAARPA
jgi:carboxymethylenebutenolidase